MRWAGHVVRAGAVLNACRILDVKPQGKVVLGYVGERSVDMCIQ